MWSRSTRCWWHHHRSLFRSSHLYPQLVIYSDVHPSKHYHLLKYVPCGLRCSQLMVRVCVMSASRSSCQSLRSWECSVSGPNCSVVQTGHEALVRSNVSWSFKLNWAQLFNDSKITFWFSNHRLIGHKYIIRKKSFKNTIRVFNFQHYNKKQQLVLLPLYESIQMCFSYGFGCVIRQSPSTWCGSVLVHLWLPTHWIFMLARSTVANGHKTQELCCPLTQQFPLRSVGYSLSAAHSTDEMSAVVISFFQCLQDCSR